MRPTGRGGRGNVAITGSEPLQADRHLIVFPPGEPSQWTHEIWKWGGESTVSNLYGTGRICALIESSLILAWVEVTLQITGGASGGEGPQLVMESEKNCMGEESLESAHTNVWPLSVSEQKRLWLKNKLGFLLQARRTKCRQSASQLCHQSSSSFEIPTGDLLGC